MENTALKCLCRNSIKLKILEAINTDEEPFEIINLIELIATNLMNENKDLKIDDNFLKSYIFKIIKDLSDCKMINIKNFKFEEINDDLVYIKMNTGNLIPKEIDIQKTTTSNIKEEENIDLIDELISLKKQYDRLKKENKDKALHQALHKYNEIKDIAQGLLGYIASKKKIQVKELYEDLNISDDE